MKRLTEIIDDFKGKKVGIIGDLMLDQFTYGKIERMSPEAPVSIILTKKEVFMPGGAGNTAANIVALGGEVFVIGVVGKDCAGKKLLEELKKRGIKTKGIIRYSKKPTIQKTRLLDGNKQVLRVDKEDAAPIDGATEKKILKFASLSIKKWDAIVISDYAKGTITKNLAKKIIATAKKCKKPVIADVKPKNISFFKNIDLLKINSKESAEITKIDDVNESGKVIQGKLGCNVIITQGDKGMSLFENNKIAHFSPVASQVIDVSGAGDTVVAALSMSLVSGADLKQAANISNHAAGIAIGKSGTAVAYLEELKKIFRTVD